MRKIKMAVIIGILLLSVVLVFLAGPRIAIDETLISVSLPENLDRFVADQESAYADIVPGAEKKIIWASGPGIQTEYAVVYVHGFSATRQETAPLADLVAKKLGANLFYTRMTGHGRSGQAMRDASVNAWLNDTVQAFEIGKRLGRKVIMMGVSTGGTAVTWLAAKTESQGLHACVLISPNFGPADRDPLFSPGPGACRLQSLRSAKSANGRVRIHCMNAIGPTATRLPPFCP